MELHILHLIQTLLLRGGGGEIENEGSAFRHLELHAFSGDEEGYIFHCCYLLFLSVSVLEVLPWLSCQSVY